MSHTQERQSYHVRWFIDIHGVREDVTVTIEDGMVVGIASGRLVPSIDLGDVALIPGLVNAHTHLEFSLIETPIPTNQRFTDWIRCVVGHRRSHPDSTRAAIRAGMDETIRSGTTLVGDIATTGWGADDYLAVGFRGVVYQELLGLTEERIASQLDVAQARCKDSESFSASFLLGLSPHAPYSVHPTLFQSSVETASHSAVPVAMHLAETQAELELLADGTGEFREMLSDFGLWRERLFGGSCPMDYLSVLAKSPRSLVVHGNYLNEMELQFLARQPAMTLVYCPRTHAAFGHRPHPWRRLLELGGSVAIGTDSRASNPDLSLFAELQFLATLEPDLSHLELLRLGTEAGRFALTGVTCQKSTMLGKRRNSEMADRELADFCVVGWNSAITADPERNLFASGNRVLATMIAGEWRFVAPEFLLNGALQ